MKTATNLFLAVLVVGLVLGGCGIGTQNISNLSIDDEVEKTGSDKVVVSGESVPMTVVKSLRDGGGEFRLAPQLPSCQFWLMKQVVKVAKANGWDGKDTSKMPVKPDEIDLKYLEECGDREVARVNELAMPVEVEPLYLSETAVKEIKDLVWQARGEFLAYARKVGVNQKYLDDFEKNGFPKDEKRFKYEPNKEKTAGSNYTVGFSEDESGRVDDYSKRMLMMNAHAIYVMAYDMEKSGILDPKKYASKLDYDKEWRDIAVRYTVYHEMTHVMQTEINALNVPEAKDKTSKTAWVRAARNVLKIDNRHFRKWGAGDDELFAGIYNLAVAKESQAEGIAATMVMEAYDLSEGQRKLFWEFKFGRLREAAANLKEAMDIVEANWPEVNAKDLAYKIGEDVFAGLPGTETENKIKRYGVRIAKWLATMDYYQGVLNPMLPSETPKFWEYLKTEPEMGKKVNLDNL